MNGRLRTLAALLALFALSAYFAESVMASWCAPADAVPAAVSGDGADADSHGGAHHHGSSESAPGTEHSESHSSSCPFGMMGGGASCVSASLPAAGEIARPAPAIQVALLPLSDQSPGLLLVTAHFRPPRA